MQATDSFTMRGFCRSPLDNNDSLIRALMYRPMSSRRSEEDVPSESNAAPPSALESLPASQDTDFSSTELDDLIRESLVDALALHARTRIIAAHAEVAVQGQNVLTRQYIDLCGDKGSKLQ
jgi:hypothetical protein